jgi:hypothetical protein
LGEGDGDSDERQPLAHRRSPALVFADLLLQHHHIALR